MPAAVETTWTAAFASESPTGEPATPAAVETTVTTAVKPATHTGVSVAPDVVVITKTAALESATSIGEPVALAAVKITETAALQPARASGFQQASHPFAIAIKTAASAVVFSPLLKKRLRVLPKQKAFASSEIS